MLKLAGRVADGTITWMTGTATVGGHIAPTITAAAEAAGRPAPRVGRVAARSPSRTTSTPPRSASNEAFAIYPNLPSYKAMLDKEGAEAAADIGFVGDEEAVAASIVEAGRGRAPPTSWRPSSATPRSATVASRLISELARS